jgi:hypothetical protein
MFDDIRNHDAEPTPEESAWMDIDAIALIVRLLALAGLALAVGVSVSLLVEPEGPLPVAASTAPR